jgi:hypothetical protein
MTLPVSLPLCTVSTHHGPDAGQAPTLNGADPDVSHSPFENFYGEQSLVMYNRTIRSCPGSLRIMELDLSRDTHME